MQGASRNKSEKRKQPASLINGQGSNGTKKGHRRCEGPAVSRTDASVKTETEDPEERRKLNRRQKSH